MEDTLTVTTKDIPISHKIIDFEQACIEISKLKAEGKQVVYTSGCFDILHVGHVQYLQAGKSKGDILVVGLESDKTIENTRGKGRPINSAVARAEVISALACVDYVFVFEDELISYANSGDVFAERYKGLSPTFVLMPGQTATDIQQRDQILSSGAKLLFFPDLVAGKSSTIIIKKILSS